MTLSTNDWEQINDSLKKINEISTDERQVRKNIMTAIRSAIYYDFGDFCYITREDDGLQVAITDPVSLSRFPREFQMDYEYEYQRYFGSMDYTKWYVNSSESLVFRESDFIDAETRQKAKYYKEFLEPRGLTYCMGCYIINDKFISTPSTVTLYRDSNQPDFSKRDLEVFNVLLPHIENRMSQLSFPGLGKSGSNKKSSGVDAVDIYLMNKYGLTRREIAVAKEVSLGHSNAEIAEHLEISVHTVKKHISHILQKTEVSSRTRLMKLL